MSPCSLGRKYPDPVLAPCGLGVLGRNRCPQGRAINRGERQAFRPKPLWGNPTPVRQYAKMHSHFCLGGGSSSPVYSLSQLASWEWVTDLFNRIILLLLYISCTSIFHSKCTLRDYIGVSVRARYARRCYAPGCYAAVGGRRSLAMFCNVGYSTGFYPPTRTRS